MLTATLLGVPGAVRVVVGPLKQQSAPSRARHVSSGIMLGPPCSSHHSAPPSHVTNSALAPLALRTSSIASTSSGPVPSPLISATFLLFKPSLPRATPRPRTGFNGWRGATHPPLPPTSLALLSGSPPALGSPRAVRAPARGREPPQGRASPTRSASPPQPPHLGRGPPPP